MKMNIFRGDLTDVSAKKEALCKMWVSDNLEGVFKGEFQITGGVIPVQQGLSGIEMFKCSSIKWPTKETHYKCRGPPE